MLLRREGSRVTPLELFFDLVFVYALTQVVDLMNKTNDVAGLFRGLVVLGLLWWCWCAFAWLGNTVHIDEGVPRFALFAVMAAMFVISLTVPEAFKDIDGGLHGPLVFAICYLVVRLLHLFVYWFASAGDAGLRRQVKNSLLVMAVATIPLFVAAFVSRPWPQIGLWALVLALDWGWTLLNGTSGWRVNSAAHWAERHGLVIILALGESIVSIGVGAANLPISWSIVVAAACGMAVAACLWWVYFDITALQTEHILAGAQGDARSRLAVHGYTYLHFTLVAGIVLLAFGLKKVLSYTGDLEHHTLSEALHGVGLLALFGGPALYLLGHTAFALRMFGVVKVQRLVAGLVLLVLIAVGGMVPALVSVALVAVVVAALVTYETRKYADVRAEVRASIYED
jgi:low temperature requirement protein LtrA